LTVTFPEEFDILFDLPEFFLALVLAVQQNGCVVVARG
jgi:hypothetical protein